MSYETHVTMIINCLTVCVYAYTVIGLVDLSLVMVIFAAKTIPPTGIYAMLFNLCFGVMTVSLVIKTQYLFKMLFFAEAVKEGFNQPLSTTTYILPGGGAVKRCVYNTQERGSGGVYLLSVPSLDNKESAKPEQPGSAAPASGAESAANPSPVQSPMQCPGTPDSQADTESESHGTHVDLAKLAKEAMVK